MRRACEGWASCHPRIALCAIALHVVVHSIMLVALVARGDFVGRKPRSKRKEAPPRGGAFSRMPFAIGLWQIAGDGASEVDRRHNLVRRGCIRTTRTSGGLVRDLAVATSTDAPIAESGDPVARGCAAPKWPG
jgi:hypothetical protein